MTQTKLFALLGLLVLALTASGPSAANEPTIAAPSSEFYMTYQIDGIHEVLSRASLVTVRNDQRYQIQASSDVQGDKRLILIQNFGGPPAIGTYTTGAHNLVFGIGTQTGSRSTLDHKTQSFGSGLVTINEITDTYVKGTFSFIADIGDEDDPIESWDLTNGIFKAKITIY